MSTILSKKKLDKKKRLNLNTHMSNKKNKKTLDIKQWHSLLITLLSRVDKNKVPNHHVEDIAIDNKKTFPNFFSWSKHKEYIDLRQVMRTMDKLKEEGFINGANTELWSLTKKGFDFATKLNEFEHSTDSKKMRQNSDFYSQEIVRALQSPCFTKFKHDETNSIENSELKYLFRIDSYNSNVDSVMRNKERLYIATSGNSDAKKFLDTMWDLLFEREILKRSDYE